jgi:hypothetical protein
VGNFYAVTALRLRRSWRSPNPFPGVANLHREI